MRCVALLVFIALAVAGRAQESSEHRVVLPAPSDRFRAGPGAPSSSWEFVGPKNLMPPRRAFYGPGPISGPKNCVAYAPSNPNIVYTASMHGGIWRSADGGVTWTPRSQGMRFRNTFAVAVHPTNPDVVIATEDARDGLQDNLNWYEFVQPFWGGTRSRDGRIYRSTDGGQNWTKVYDAGTTVIGVAFDKVNPSVVIACGPQQLLTSADGGVSWTAMDAPLPFAHIFFFQAVAAGGDGTLYAHGHYEAYLGYRGEYIFRSTDHGASWQGAAQPWDPPYPDGQKYLAASPSTPGLVVLADIAKRTVRRSYDFGVTLENISPPADSPVWFDDVWTSSRDALAINWDGHILFGGRTMLLLRAGENTWRDIGAAHTANAKLHTGAYSVSFKPDDPTQGLIATAGGLTWFQLLSNGAANMLPRNASFTDFPLGSYLRLNPADPTFITASSTYDGAPSARGDLNNWTLLNPLSRTWHLSTMLPGFDDANPARLYTIFGGYAYRYDGAGVTPTSLPNLIGSYTSVTMAGPTGSDQFLLGPYPDAARNVGGSGAWSYTTTAANTNIVQRSARHPERLFSTGGPNIFQYSMDGGATWNYIDHSTYPGQGTNFEVRFIADSPFEDEEIICIGWLEVPRPLLDSYEGRYIVYKLRNYSTNPVWTLVGQGTGVIAPPMLPSQSIAWDPFDPDTIYFGSISGIFMSPDKGARMFDMAALGGFPDRTPVMAVATRGDYLYAQTEGFGIYRIRLMRHELASLSVAKNAVFGGQPIYLTVSLTGKVPVATQVMLNDDSLFVATPASTWIQKWQQSTTITIPTNVVSSPTTATITGTCKGVSKSTTFTLWPVPGLASVSVNPGSIYWGYPCTGTVTLGAASGAVVVVNLTDDSTSAAVPGSVAIPANALSASFPVTSTSVANPTTVTITATAVVGGSTRTTSLIVSPRPVMWKVELAKATFKGGYNTTLTSFITAGAPPGGAVVTLGDNLAEVTLPATVTVLAGQTSRACTVVTSAVTITTTGTITGTYNGVTKSVTITLTP